MSLFTMLQRTTVTKVTLYMKRTVLILIFFVLAIVSASGQSGVNLQLQTYYQYGPAWNQLKTYRVDFQDSSYKTLQVQTYRLFTDGAGRLDSVISGLQDSGEIRIRVFDCNGQIAFNRQAIYDTSSISFYPLLKDTAYVSCVSDCQGFVNQTINGGVMTLEYVQHPSWSGELLEYRFSNGQYRYGNVATMNLPSSGTLRWWATHFSCEEDSGEFFVGVSSCQANYIVDTVNSFASNAVVWNVSDSSGSAATVEYLWDFGDGTTATGPFPTHTYAQPGVVTVTLYMKEFDAAGDSVCESQFSETFGMDANGDLLYKSGWTLNVMDPFSIGIQELNENRVKLYPQPANEFILVESERMITTYELFDFSGRIVKSESVHQNNLKINTGDCPPGVYTLRISTSNHIQHLKMVIE